MQRMTWWCQAAEVAEAAVLQGIMTWGFLVAAVSRAARQWSSCEAAACFGVCCRLPASVVSQPAQQCELERLCQSDC